MILQSNLTVCPSGTFTLRGLRTNRGMASRRSEIKNILFKIHPWTQGKRRTYFNIMRIFLKYRMIKERF